MNNKFVYAFSERMKYEMIKLGYHMVYEANGIFIFENKPEVDLYKKIGQKFENETVVYSDVLRF